MNGVSNVPQRIRPCAAADAAIITVMVCCIVATSNSLLTGKPDRVIVYRQNAVVARYPLGDDIAFTVGGKRGPLDIEIKNGTVAILHADCPGQICRQYGAIRRSHEQLICAPNNILVEIQSVKDSENIDGVTY